MHCSNFKSCELDLHRTLAMVDLRKYLIVSMNVCWFFFVERSDVDWNIQRFSGPVTLTVIVESSQNIVVKSILEITKA